VIEPGWHYNEDAVSYGPWTCQYIFVLDSLNFCFWEISGLEYDTLAIALRDAILSDSSCFSAERLSRITSVSYQLDDQLVTLVHDIFTSRMIYQPCFQ
jgi:hypothetical protein